MAETRGTPTEIHITRSESLDPAVYRERKAEAERLGRTLVVVDDKDAPPSANDGPPQPSPVKFILDPDSGIGWVNSQFRDQYGIARTKEYAEENGANDMRTFRSTRDLPDHLQQAHVQHVLDKTNLLNG